MNTVKVLDVVQGRHGQQRAELHGDYEYEDIKTEGPISCDWQIVPQGVGLNVSGHLQGTLILDCARCLEPYTVPIDLDIRERYVFDQYVEHSGREKELTSTDYFDVVDEYGELDLKDLAHQFLVLEADTHSNCGDAGCALVG